MMKLGKGLLILFILLLVTCISYVSASDIDENETSNYKELSFDKSNMQVDLKKIATRGEDTIAIGSCGGVLHSRDLIHWDKAYLNTDSNLQDVIWDGKQFVVVGDKGFIATSLHGLKWEILELDEAKHEEDFLSIAYNGSHYVMSLESCAILQSKDLRNWNYVDPYVERPIIKLDYLDGQFIGITGDADQVDSYYPRAYSPSMILTSTDGSEWQEKIPQFDDSDMRLAWNGQDLRGLSFDGVNYYAISTEIETYQSKDLINWTPINKSIYANLAYDLIKIDDKVIMCSRRGALVFQGDNEPDALKGNFKDVIVVNGIPVAVGDNETIAVYKDGYWITRNIHTRFITGNICKVKDTYYAVPYRYNKSNTSYEAMKSKDGIKWERVNIRKEPIGIVYGAETYLAYHSDYSSTIMTATEDRKWTEEKIILDGKKYNHYFFQNKIIWSGKSFIASGRDNSGGDKLYMSMDGVKWETVYESDEVNMRIKDIVLAEDKVVAIGYIHKANNHNYKTPIILESTNGRRWHKREIDITREGLLISDNYSHINTISWTGHDFIGLGVYSSRYPKSAMFKSKDGVSWEVYVIDKPTYYRHLSYNGEEYIAYGLFGHIAYSKNGLSWKKVDTPVMDTINACIWENNTYTFYTDKGAILTKKYSFSSNN